MKISIWSDGKNHEAYIKDGVAVFTKRITHYYPIDWLNRAPSKATQPAAIKKEEAQNIMKPMASTDVLILLDETGKMLNSPGLAQLIQQKANQSTQKIIFLIGGAYGVSDDIKKRANHTWSLSQLVFPHMLVRLILSEQIYRACSSLANEKYHHE